MDILKQAIIKPHIVDSLGESVGNIWKGFQNNAKGAFYVASPISNTPKPIYEWIIAHAHEFEHWDKLKFVMMDEQVEKDAEENYRYVPVTDSASYVTKIQNLLLRPIKERIHVPVQNSIVMPEVQHMEKLDEEIENHGGLDLLLLAIDVNGQYAQVYPGTSVDTGFHVAKLQEEYRRRHTQSTGLAFSGSHFREQGMSLGPKQVMSAKHIVIIISGAHKGDVTKQFLERKEFDPNFPMSIIFHPEIKGKVEIYLTKDVLE